MKYKTGPVAAVLLALIIILNCIGTARAVTSDMLSSTVSDTAQYLYNIVKNPQVGSIGGEWAVLGLARSGYEVPGEYYHKYYKTVEEYVKACGGVLHAKKYTEYSRVILGLTAAGYDPTKVAGYDLTKPLGDFDKTIWQGINGPIFALISLDSGNYAMPKNPDAASQATRDMYIDEILRRQLADGGFSLFGGSKYATAGDKVSDPDITAMALQALAKYQDRDDVKKVTGEALACLSRMQNSSGGFASWGTTNSESCAQVIVALTELGIPVDDPRFVKKGHTPVDNLLTFYIQGGGFLHTADGSGSSQMASEQAFYALVAVQRAQEGKSSLYRMAGAAKAGDSIKEKDTGKIGLPGKHADVKPVPVAEPGKTFADVSAHVNRPAIEALAARGIISARTGKKFEPNATITRAEFAAFMVRGLGLPQKTKNVFKDVPAKSVYAGYINSACSYGIMKGTSATAFTPNGTITREDASVMVTCAAKLCGIDTAISEGEARDILAQFTDYISASKGTRPSLAFCYKEGILDPSDIKIVPKAAAKRCEIAQMLFNMLGCANLL